MKLITYHLAAVYSSVTVQTTTTLGRDLDGNDVKIVYEVTLPKDKDL